MNLNEIEEMARTAGFETVDSRLLERFANLVAAAERKKLSEPIRIRIMFAALDCADKSDTESYNTVKVMCNDVLEMLNEPR